MTVPNTIPEIKIAPPEGELLYINPYTGETSNIDVQGEPIYSGLVYDSYPPTYNVKGGILYVQDYGGEILYASDVQANDVKITKDISTKPIDLKNTNANIRKIKPDINSKLKRV